MKVLLNKSKSKLSNNTNTNVKSAIHSDSRLLPLENNEKVIDEYKQYLNEKNKSRKYRLSFAINPICSNVLFNNVSEIVYKEGSDDCVFFGRNGYNKNENSNAFENDENINRYLKYKKVEKSVLNRNFLISDTSFSHPNIGGIEYHCGYDIFNNHFLRNKEFVVINKISDGITDKNYTKNFNTLFDYKRNHEGETIEENIDCINKYKDEEKFKYQKVHTYQIDTVYTFEESINENLIEKDGWIGFTNKCTIDIPNYYTEYKSGNTNFNLSINKCMNNRESCDMIDMYPDRSLYSFTPKINEFRGNRSENNWDYCITYPYSNFYDNKLVTFKCDDFTVNGLECFIYDDIIVYEEGEPYVSRLYEDAIITLKTNIRNNIKKGSLVDIVIIGKINGITTNMRLPNFETVRFVGYEGKDENYYFSIYGEQLLDYIQKFDNFDNDIELRVRQVINGGLCKYYFRQFRRLPKLTNSGAKSNDDSKFDNTNEYSNRDFNCAVNNLGFSRNIYSDTISQILFNDDIITDGIKDNLGRNVNELFLTIVKNNKGNELWYDDKNYWDSGVTFSHCFGKITSGINIKDTNIYDYNIHSLHNVPTELYGKYALGEIFDYSGGVFDRLFIIDGENNPRQPYVLEDGITIHGTLHNGIENETFMGDIVEFSPYTLEEIVLEDVLHRFNTRQREYWKDGDNEFLDITKDEIFSDDYEVEDDLSFMSYKDKYVDDNLYNAFYKISDNNREIINGTHSPINISPEGYYYKPHYSIKLREYDKRVNQGKHTIVTIHNDSVTNNGHVHSFKTIKNYFLEVSKELYLFNRVTNEKKVATIKSVSGKNFTDIEICVQLNETEDLTHYIIFKPNSEMPNVAYDLNDGTGRYLWRDELNDNLYEHKNEIGGYTFTNGAHYINKNITFFLRRQDPNGIYGISNEVSLNPLMQNLTIAGYDVDYTTEEYIKDGEGEKC